LPTIVTSVRTRALTLSLRLLGRAIAVCSRWLFNAGMTTPEIARVVLDDTVVEHPDLETERALVIQALESPEPRQRSEIEMALNDIAPLAIDIALLTLEAEGVLYAGGGWVYASACSKHLDRLNLIAL
jgi:hypothetical protein